MRLHKVVNCQSSGKQSCWHSLTGPYGSPCYSSAQKSEQRLLAVIVVVTVKKTCLHAAATEKVKARLPVYRRAQLGSPHQGLGLALHHSCRQEGLTESTFEVFSLRPP